MIEVEPYAVWLYGSNARGDCDALSDLDVLMISDGDVTETVDLPGRASVSRYTWSEFAVLAASGSLFLHHLRLEGRVLQANASGRIRSVGMVSNVGPYRHVRRDLAGFRHVLSDVVAARGSGSTPEYELGVLGTLSRHSAILASYLVGEPCFSRHRVFAVACHGLGLLPSTGERLRELYAYRMVLEGRSSIAMPAEWRDVDEAGALISHFLSRLEDTADAYQQTVS
jgi:hypothetical protein